MEASIVVEQPLGPPRLWQTGLDLCWPSHPGAPPTPQQLAIPPEKPSSAASLLPPLGGLRPTSTGGVAYKSEETSPPCWC